jgi:hypothetical protein
MKIPKLINYLANMYPIYIVLETPPLNSPIPNTSPCPPNPPPPTKQHPRERAKRNHKQDPAAVKVKKVNR